MLLNGRCHELKSLLIQTCHRFPTQTILLSGGLDSSILASITRPQHAITIGFGTKAEDFTFSGIIAKRFCHDHIKVYLNHEKLLSIMNSLIGLMKTFDPIEIRNSSVLYAGIEESKRRGYTGVITGDGCDELFAGYDYMRRLDSNIKHLDLELNRIWRIMHFSSRQIGKALGITVWSPYLEKPFFNYAQRIDTSEKIGHYEGKNWGKFILRKCFEEDIGKEITWRAKRAQERGANITPITNVISEAFDDDRFVFENRKAMDEGVMIRNREHLYYYLLYRRKFPAPRMDDEDFKFRCPKCLCPFTWEGSYCRTCGSYPVSPLLK
jgi:asparagine synthase (glutamine-hydrolysing)